MPLTEPAIDCHVHVFDPLRFPYATDTWYTGPGILQCRMEGQHPSLMVICHTPVEDGEVRVWFGLFVKVGDERADAAGVSMARSYQDTSLDAFARSSGGRATKRSGCHCRWAAK